MENEGNYSNIIPGGATKQSECECESEEHSLCF